MKHTIVTDLDSPASKEEYRAISAAFAYLGSWAACIPDMANNADDREHLFTHAFDVVGQKSPNPGIINIRRPDWRRDFFRLGYIPPMTKLMIDFPDGYTYEVSYNFRTGEYEVQEP